MVFGERSATGRNDGNSRIPTFAIRLAGFVRARFSFRLGRRVAGALHDDLSIRPYVSGRCGRQIRSLGATWLDQQLLDDKSVRTHTN